MSASTEEFLVDAAVLICTTDRDDRRRLFDVFDAYGPRAIYTASTTAQARGMLAEDSSVGVVVMDLGLDVQASGRLIPELLSREDWTGVIIGIWPAPDGRDAMIEVPDGLDECVSSPIRSQEVIYRLDRLLAGTDDSAGDAVAAGGGASLAFSALDDGPMDYALALYPEGRIERASASFGAAMKRSVDSVVGSPLDDYFAGLDDDQRRVCAETLERDGAVEFRCRWRSPDDERLPIVVQSRVVNLDGRAHTLSLVRDMVTEEHLTRALTILSNGGTDVDALSRTMESLSEWLDLDQLLAVQGDLGGEQVLQVVAASSRGELEPALLDPRLHMPLRRIATGDSVVARASANAVIPDESFIGRAGIESYVGLPLYVGGRVIGALMAASRDRIEPWDYAVASLRALASLAAAIAGAEYFRRRSLQLNLQDPLTRLPNRTLFNDRLGTALREAQRSGEMLAVLFVDLDRFQNVNESLGHRSADEVLKLVAQRLTGALRGSDTIARYAADGFTLLLRNVVQREDVVRVCEKINRVVSEPMRLEGEGDIQFTASIGVALHPEDGASVDELVQKSELAKQSAKVMGRDTHHFFVEEREDPSRQKLVLESRLRSAEANGELRVFYQPQLDVHSEDIVAVEALIRWQHPELGLISPGFFIPLAEATGLIVPMGRWILRQAAQDVQHWRSKFGLDLRVGVNLSALQIRQPDLTSTIRDALAEAHLPAEALELEVTESLEIKNIPKLQEVLQGLREMGCAIAIDDFGTGRSSLDYLRRFPADRIKIDQTFVRNIGLDADDEAIVQATIAMAHSLALEVVAEGVEEETHLNFLRRNNCDILQGFLFCRPLPAIGFEKLLADRERAFRAANL